MRYAMLLLMSCLSLYSVALTAQADETTDPCAQDSPQAMAKAVGVELPPRPWHLANIWWNFEQPIEHFTSLEVDITIDRDVPDTYNLYISPCGLAKINGLQFYGGIQSNINGWADKQSRERVHRGHGAIFSRWSSDKKMPIGLDHVQMADDECLVESAGYEGEFASVRRPYVWKQGTYTWSITKGETVEHKGTPATWFTCKVKNHADDSELEVGSLLFEGEDFTYWNRHSAFVEVYSTSKIRRSNIPKVNVTFGWPRINGEKAPLKNASAFYPSVKQGSTSSPDCAKVRADGDNCVVEVAEIFVRDEAKRRHDLPLGK
ncbi:DUF3472 domain-containing protein [Aeoliella mucimassa]|uniref:Secreted protein n=1 Tax=Aeoliella mucimassa TaxID=2527972 RepID=A0A518AKN4_9BACT|nr:hypothetical protein [Aeoliella mucimassa]QDU55293.1 hypothetical protein Pan181_14820 [Aeoliella mucimassa]